MGKHSQHQRDSAAPIHRPNRPTTFFLSDHDPSERPQQPPPLSPTEPPVSENTLQQHLPYPLSTTAAYPSLARDQASFFSSDLGDRPFSPAPFLDRRRRFLSTHQQIHDIDILSQRSESSSPARQSSPRTNTPSSYAGSLRDTASILSESESDGPAYSSEDDFTHLSTHHNHNLQDNQDRPNSPRFGRLVRPSMSFDSFWQEITGPENEVPLGECGASVMGDRTTSGGVYQLSYPRPSSEEEIAKEKRTSEGARVGKLKVLVLGTDETARKAVVDALCSSEHVVSTKQQSHKILASTYLKPKYFPQTTNEPSAEYEYNVSILDWPALSGGAVTEIMDQGRAKTRELINPDSKDALAMLTHSQTSRGNRLVDVCIWAINETNLDTCNDRNLTEMLIASGSRVGVVPVVFLKDGARSSQASLVRQKIAKHLKELQLTQLDLGLSKEQCILGLYDGGSSDSSLDSEPQRHPNNHKPSALPHVSVVSSHGPSKELATLVSTLMSADGAARARHDSASRFLKWASVKTSTSSNTSTMVLAHVDNESKMAQDATSKLVNGILTHYSSRDQTGTVPANAVVASKQTLSNVDPLNLCTAAAAALFAGLGLGLGLGLGMVWEYVTSASIAAAPPATRVRPRSVLGALWAGEISLFRGHGHGDGRPAMSGLEIVWQWMLAVL